MEKIDLSRSRRSKKPKKKGLERLYDKKPLIELVVAILSIPSLILLVLLNYNTLRNLNKTATPTTAPAANTSTPATNNTIPNFFSRPITHSPRPTQSTITSSQSPCNKHLGPVSISSPDEGQVITSNPVEVDISYDATIYCSAVWSYSINGSNWSDYSSSSVALYNLPDGPVTFNLRVMSLTSSDTTTLTRHFTYNGHNIAPVPTTASSSAQ